MNLVVMYSEMVLLMQMLKFVKVYSILLRIERCLHVKSDWFHSPQRKLSLNF